MLAPTMVNLVCLYTYVVEDIVDMLMDIYIYIYI